MSGRPVPRMLQSQGEPPALSSGRGGAQLFWIDPELLRQRRMIPGYLRAVRAAHDFVANPLHHRADILISQSNVIHEGCDEGTVLPGAVESDMSGCGRVGDERPSRGRKFGEAPTKPKILAFSFVAAKRQPPASVSKRFFVLTRERVVAAGIQEYC